LGMLAERILPDLSANVKCGNSLIGSDYYHDKQMPLLGDEEFYRVNVFDWKRSFPEIMLPSPSGRGAGGEGGGFDAVIGNPPYIRIQAMKEWASEQVDFYKEKYLAAQKGNYDIYVVFVEKALSLLNAKGLLGFILPHKFFNAQYGAGLRKILAEGKHLSKIVHFGDQQVFANATTYTCLLFLNQDGQKDFEFEKVSDLAAWQVAVAEQVSVEQNPGFSEKPGFSVSGRLAAEKATEDEWNFVVGAGAGLFEKLSAIPTKLSDVTRRVFQGFKTGADTVFILEVMPEKRFYSKALECEIDIEDVYLRPLYKSGNMKRYKLQENTRFVLFPYLDGKLISWHEIKENAPKTAKYLESCKTVLHKRENGRFTGMDWYCYSRNQALEIIANPKILTADLNPFANYCYDASGEACFPGGAAGGYGIITKDYSPLYVLGVFHLSWSYQAASGKSE